MLNGEGLHMSRPFFYRHKYQIVIRYYKIRTLLMCRGRQHTMYSNWGTPNYNYVINDNMMEHFNEQQQTL